MTRSIFTYTITLLFVVALSFSVSSQSVDAKLIAAFLLDEGNGDKTTDASENAIEGVLMGGPEWVDGKFGKALKCEPNKYVDFPPPTPEVLMLEQDFTVMCWVNPQQWIGGWQAAFSMQAGSTGGEIYGIYFGNQGGSEILLWTRINGAGQSVRTGPGALELEQWAHCAVTYDGSKMIAYKNGEAVAESDVAGKLDNADRQGRFVINGNYNSLNGGLGEFVDSLIDEVIIFDEALPADEIMKFATEGFEKTMAVEAAGKLAVTWGEIKKP